MNDNVDNQILDNQIHERFWRIVNRWTEDVVKEAFQRANYALQHGADFVAALELSYYDQLEADCNLPAYRDVLATIGDMYAGQPEYALKIVAWVRFDRLRREAAEAAVDNVNEDAADVAVNNMNGN